MQLTLTDEEARTLHTVLHNVLPELRFEQARTDLPARELRHELENRVAVCERMLAQLELSGIVTVGKAS